jgi:hypothetical protein
MTFREIVPDSKAQSTCFVSKTKTKIKKPLQANCTFIVRDYMCRFSCQSSRQMGKRESGESLRRISFIKATRRGKEIMHRCRVEVLSCLE